MGVVFADPKTLLELVQADVDDGFAEWLSGGLAEAKERFGGLCTAGKLGLVHREGAACDSANRTQTRIESCVWRR